MSTDLRQAILNRYLGIVSRRTIRAEQLRAAGQTLQAEAFLRDAETARAAALAMGACAI